MATLYYCNGDQSGSMLRAMQQAMPDLDIRVWPNTGNKLEIDRAIVWLPPADFFDGLDNLCYVYSISAGVDHLLLHPGLSNTTPLVRLYDAGMGEKMANYVLYGALHAQRKMPEFFVAQQNKEWASNVPIPSPSEINVGILGVGALGTKVANQLILNGFLVSSWSRSENTIAGVTHYVGEAGKAGFLTNAQVLVCLLPLTINTKGILNSAMFDALPDGAFLINPGRGPHLQVDHLLQALDSGKLSGAMLDVFDAEPLPPSSPLWQHERIIVTPHVAAASSELDSAEQIAQSMADVAAGVAPRGLVDRSRGY